MDKNDKTKDKKSVASSSDMTAEMAELKKKVEEYENKYKRVLADYQNLEKRVAEERKEWIRKSNKELLLRILPILDTLILAKGLIKGGDEGLSLSIKQFQDLLKAEGVEKIEVVGKQFDPSLMQCVETQEGEDGKVLEEVQAGYRYKDNTLLRASIVRVGKRKTEKEEEEKAKKELQKGDYM